MGEDTRRSRFTKLLPAFFFFFLAVLVVQARTLQDESFAESDHRANAARVQRDLDGHFEESTSAKLSASEITVDQVGDEIHDDEDHDNNEEVDFPEEIKFPLPDVIDVEDGANTTLPSRQNKRVLVRIPISRGEGSHKVTVVRRRPLTPLSGAKQALPAPRRVIVTRIRTPSTARTTKYETQSRNFASEPEYDGLLTPRHKVTVTRRRKILPTSSEKEVIKSRVTRKKLVNVRPVSLLTPTPTATPTLAIITTGFYEAAVSSEDYSDVESDDENGDYGDDTRVPEYSEHETKNYDLSTPTPSLDDTLNIVGNGSNEIVNDVSESVTPAAPIPTEAPVILTDHFFLPSDDEEDYDDEVIDGESFSLETEEATTLSATEPTTPMELENLDPSSSVSVQKSLMYTVLSQEGPVTAQSTRLDLNTATVSKQPESNPASTSSLPTNLLGESSAYPNLVDIIIEPSKASTGSFASAVARSPDPTRIVTSISPAVIEDTSTGLSEPHVAVPPTSSIPETFPIGVDETSALNSEPTASVYYSETVVTSTRLRTYTYVVTKLNGLETEVTSSTAVKPKVTILTLTVPVTATLPYAAVATSSAASLPSTQWIPPSSATSTSTPPKPNDPPSPVYSPDKIDDDETAKVEPEDEQGRRFNLATRILSNGVEVIVAGSTPAPALRWETASPPATLTLSDAMVMLMPKDEPQEFVTKTCATTFTYITTMSDQGGSTRTSTQQQVVYNTATVERHSPADSTISSIGLSLEASPSLGTEVFETTYAYHELPVDNRGSTVIRNTVTAPQEYLDLVLEPSEAPLPETNTYLSTRTLEKTIAENGKATVQAVNDVVTRLVVTESARSPRPTTSIDGIAAKTSSTSAELESDVVKTYYVTYSYYSTFLEQGSTVVRTNVATSADLVTEKVLARRPTTTNTALVDDTITSSETTVTPPASSTPVTPTISETPTTSAKVEPIQIFATKTYLTTFTYFTTLLQAGVNGKTSTTVSSRSRIVENVVTESIAPSLLDAGYMNALLTTTRPQEESVAKPSNVNQVNNVVTGSTIIFFDEEDRVDPTSTSITPTPIATEAVAVSTVTAELETRPTTPDSTGENTKIPEGNNDASAAGSGSFDSLGSFTNFGINGLSALGPVITAMAGLLQGKPTASRRNGTVDGDQDTTTQRSPIYIPVSEFADGDIETAESQNIGNQLANLNHNYIPETRHKSSVSLVKGIPISPGEVITANSDVIIGKPGKIGGPRPPQSTNTQDKHVGIRPPPIPPQVLSQSDRPHVHRPTIHHHKTQLQIFPARQVFEEHLQLPVRYGASAESHQVQVAQKHPQRLILRTDSGHDVMENDPLLIPPASPTSSIVRGKPPAYADRSPVPDPNEPEWSPERYRRPWSAKDPLKPLELRESLASGNTQWHQNDAEEAASSSSEIHGSLGKPNSWSNHRDHQLVKDNHERPPWAQRDPLLPGNTVIESSVQPKVPEPTSIIRHVVPHIIDRDTGQPLLVNIQPSQVANVVIPQGGNQALIFGDTNEPHITGQYFDDPSPYPEPEVAPGFTGVQKVEHSPQYLGQGDPSEYMVPPPSPQSNFKPLPQSHGGHLSAHQERPGYGHTEILVHPGTTPVRDYNQVYRRPVTSPATSPPRRTEVETSPHRYILLGKPGDLRPVNEVLNSSQSWKLNDGRKPALSQSATQTIIQHRPSGHFGPSMSRPTSNPHGPEIHMGRPGAYPAKKPQYSSGQPSLHPPPSSQSSYRPHTKKPDANLIPPDWSPPKNTFIREPSHTHSGSGIRNDIIVTNTETVPISSKETDVSQILHPPPFQVNSLRDSETTNYHHMDRIDPSKMGATESSAVQQSTGENVPTGAIEYHDPSTDPKVKPEDISYYPRLPTVKPEVQSFGEILPQNDEDRAPEIWTVNTQTERSSLSNDSEISESQPVPTRGDMPPETNTKVDYDSELNVPGNHVTVGSDDSLESVGSITTVGGRPLEVDQSLVYGQKQHTNKQQGQNTLSPNRGAPFAHRDHEPAIVQGTPFRQNFYEGKRPYESPIIMPGKPFGVYVDSHVNVIRPYGYNQRETHRPPIRHNIVQGVPFGYHGNQKVGLQPNIHQMVLPPRNENGAPPMSTPNSMDRGDAMDLKPPPIAGVIHQHQHQVPGPFGPNRTPGKENKRPQPTSAQPEIMTMPPQPSPALAPPAQPGAEKDFTITIGNQSRPNSMGSGSYYEDNSESELNLAESAYQLLQPSDTRTKEGSGAVHHSYPSHSKDVARPRPSLATPGQGIQYSQQSNNHGKLEFSMPVESTGDDNEDSDTQTERPPSMFSGMTTTKKTPTHLAALPTNITASPPVVKTSINREDSMKISKNNSYPVTEVSPVISQTRPRPRVPYRDMMPPPLTPQIVFHGSKGSGNGNAPETEGLEPPPLSTEVVGLSPPPSKYIPLEESTTTAARPFLVELLSQDMVPPAPVFTTSSRPSQEAATERPAVAVSGSFRIASAMPTSHVTSLRDAEAEIPVVHGTVDLPTIIEMHGPSPSTTPLIISPTINKSERVSIYTARPFESRPVSRLSIQPTFTLTSLRSPSTTLRPLRIDQMEPSKSSTFSVTVQQTRLPSTVSEIITSNLTTIKLPEASERPVLLQPSKETDTPSFAIEPTESLASIKTAETVAITKSPSKIHEAPLKTSTQTNRPEIRTTTTVRTENSQYSKTSVETNRNETDRETVLYMVTRVASASSSTTRTLLRTRTLTSTTVETVTETLLQPARTTTIVSSSTVLRPTTEVPVSVHQTPSDNESIFVVMSDQTPPQPGAEEVEAEYGDEDVEATRDEQDPGGNEIYRVLAGGILGAPAFPRESTAGRCVPECKTSKAEICAEVNSVNKCVCRPGFARMFLDRPCKPIYTYTLRVGLDRVGRDPFAVYAEELNDTASSDYKKLAGPTKEALDRTMMQSDLRDIYRGLDVARFTSDPNTSVEFHVQLSENASDTRLKEVVRKYLVGNNYSLGGTEVYASKDLETIHAFDFNECATEEGGPHHDCSPHAACFNRQGSYQCSCREGWADLSDNLPTYPGRVCSQAPFGCAACNNKGHCVINTNGQEVCECFPWHSGQRCQVNLKVLLIALVTTGIIFLALLGVCVGLACVGRPRRRSGKRSGDRRAMISVGGNGGDTSSEGSAADLATIPHHVPHVLPAPPQTVAPAPPGKRPSGAKRTPPSFIPAAPSVPVNPRSPRGKALLARPRDSVRSDVGATPTDEQRDRSLTVMIPRAKYRSAPQSSQSPASCKPLATNLVVDERKLISYLEDGPHPETRKSSQAGKRDSVCKEMILDPQQTGRNPPTPSHPPGALVSAGFQVSATVTHQADMESTLARSCGETTVETSTKILRTSDVLRGDQGSTLARSCGETTIQAPTKLLRLDLAEVGSTLARSCGETTIQPPTKMAADRRSSREPRDNASDGHTMAERDVGGTLRMPAQRPPFFDPDRASDRESNFDSL
ncbi:uncharacterized protein LOC124310473 isoform X1 [Neodiprion virginianus]|uniref:uncharacterized protein LOC124310473 isoform X1 n=1 Tax=Neodiprion virginianus TaxID=2961670 RepID=UPI001EE770F5|nr:uncharacterized protein LOC124310473 isoform X1 [Neodiprion virginianus]